MNLKEANAVQNNDLRTNLLLLDVVAFWIKFIDLLDSNFLDMSVKLEMAAGYEICGSAEEQENTLLDGQSWSKFAV